MDLRAGAVDHMKVPDVRVDCGQVGLKPAVVTLDTHEGMADVVRDRQPALRQIISGDLKPVPVRVCKMDGMADIVILKPKLNPATM